ncbi:hypothetical protein [Reyranella sp. CPCC 100927]|uniref:hypothetical protein n=1 Tax=Reyranella sp. CPCC 100927 TaxID=2599616 RepID=UPI0011B6BEC0|nr:hypothetical protein [Reyranella sp. CPCC 100927]TWT11496.1 hypothetical protein FQU96_13525 [Reyranella sp. CPCC 100927]
MSLRGCVGRYTREEGRHCQNWPDDQLMVIDLLNSVGLDDGGAGGTLDGNINGRLVTGISSDALYQAITRFEDRHFPGQRNGFVAPDSPLLKCLEAVSAGGTGADIGRRLSG